MTSPPPAAARLHLRAAAIALALAALAGGAALARAHYLERRYFRAVVAETCEVKDQGIIWQQDSFAQPDVLPLYGSSELVKRSPTKASQFFESYPNGFAVSPVGRPSCTSLILLEKIAAAATKAPGHKIAIFVSPSWFTARGANSVGFEGNFSRSQALELFYVSPLSRPLKRDIAVQMLRYPQLMEKSPLISIALRGLTGDSAIDHLVFAAAQPLGWLQNAVHRLQDHFEVYQWMRGDHKIFHLVPRRAETLDWDRLIAESVSLVHPLDEEVSDSRFRYFDDDAAFVKALGDSYEWRDLDVLLRTVRELRLDALVLSMPMEKAHFQRMGVSPAAIEVYSVMLRAAAKPYGIPVVDFADHSGDPQFFADHYGHPSAKGWIYFNRALDDFFHGRGTGEF